MSRLNSSMSSLKRGLSNKGPLALTWAVTLLVLGLLILWLHMSHETAPHSAVPTSDSDSVPETNAITTPISTPPATDDDRTGTDDATDDTTDSAYDPAADTRSANPSTLPSEHYTESAGDRNGTDKPSSATTVQIHLGSVPDPDLVETGPHGPLPRVGADGKKPWHIYRRPYLGPASGPRIALVIQEIGLSRKASVQAIDQLPHNVTMAVSPYSKNPQDIVNMARDKGHEVLLMLPMEPVAYPANDPGPHSLLVSLSVAENIDRLHMVMSRFQGYAGIVNHMGSRFTTDRGALAPIISEIGSRGLLIVDARSSNHSVMATLAAEQAFPVAANNRFIDNRLSADSIDHYLSELETIAHNRGIAVGFGRPFPVTIDRIKTWEAGLALKGITLVPITAIAQENM